MADGRKRPWIGNLMAVVWGQKRWGLWASDGSSRWKKRWPMVVGVEVGLGEKKVEYVDN